MTTDHLGNVRLVYSDMRDDPRLGRWLSIDPKAASFPGVSPYVSMGNNPIMMVDPEGDFVIAQKGEKFRLFENYRRQTVDVRSEGITLNPILERIHDYVKNNDHILSVLEEYTGKSRDIILDDLKYGEGPKIFTTDMVLSGLQQEDYIILPNLYLDEAHMVCHKYNKDAGKAIALVVSSILHELGHCYGMNDSGKKNTYEMENALWGIPLDTDSVHMRGILEDKIESAELDTIDIFDEEEQIENETKNQENKETDSSD